MQAGGMEHLAGIDDNNNIVTFKKLNKNWWRRLRQYKLEGTKIRQQTSML